MWHRPILGFSDLFRSPTHGGERIGSLAEACCIGPAATQAKPNYKEISSWVRRSLLRLSLYNTSSSAPQSGAPGPGPGTYGPGTLRDSDRDLDSDIRSPAEDGVC